jgi:hypothetical protein
LLSRFNSRASEKIRTANGYSPREAPSP